MTVVDTLAGAVRDAVAAVDDPELPGVSIVELGLLERIEVDRSGSVAIGLIPTFSGCPALAEIASRVRAAVAAVDGVSRVEVEFLPAPAWSLDRVSDVARERLGDLTVAVERDGRARCPRCGTETVEQSMFGPTRCRSVHRCPGCGEVVEVMR